MRSTTNKWPRCHPRTQFAHTSKCADGALAPTAPYLCTHHESKPHQRPPHPDKPTQHTPRHKTTPKMCVRAHLPHSLQEASTNRGKPRNMRCYVAQESSARCHAAQIRLPKRSGRMFNHTYKPPHPPLHVHIPPVRPPHSHSPSGRVPASSGEWFRPLPALGQLQITEPSHKPTMHRQQPRSQTNPSARGDRHHHQMP